MHGGFLICFHKGQLSSVSFYSVINGRLQHLQRRFFKVFWKPRNVPFEGMFSEQDCHDDTLPFRHRRFCGFLGFAFMHISLVVFSFPGIVALLATKARRYSPDEPDCGWVYSGHDTKVKPNLVHSSF